MPVIEFSDEHYQFLCDLSKELNSQDNRCTAAPYFFQVMDTKTVAAYEGSGRMQWVDNDGEGTVYKTQKEAFFAVKGWELQNPEDEAAYSALTSFDIEDEVSQQCLAINVEETEVYTNAFLTEKACEEHIKCQAHHYRSPKSFLTHAFRNPELETLLEIICQITGGTSRR